MLLVVSLVVCAAVAARLVGRYDLYDREPWYLIAAAIVAGAGAMALLGDVEDRAIQWIGGGQPSFALIAGVAASVEELTRLLIVLALAVLVPKHFNDPMDGLIYGSVIGIGMALEETTLALGREAWAPLVANLPVEFVRLFGHLIMGGITGFGVGMIRRQGGGRSWIAIAAACVVTGITIHFLWDYIALSTMGPDAESWTVAASIGLMVATMGLYGALVVIGSRSSRAVFAPDSTERVWSRDVNRP